MLGLYPLWNVGKINTSVEVLVFVFRNLGYNFYDFFMRIGRFMVLCFSINFGIICYHFFYHVFYTVFKSDKRHDKAIEIEVKHSKSNFCIKLELIQPLKVEIVTKMRQKMALS